MSKKLRVLQVGKFYPPHRGGMETHLRDLCEGLRDQISVQVLVANNGRQTVEEEVGGIAVTRLGTALQIAATSWSPALASRIRQAKADIVHLHWPNPAAVLAYLTSGHQGRLLVTYQSDVIRQRLLGTLFEPVLHRFLSRAEAIIASSPNYIESSPVLRRHRSRCHVIPLSVPERYLRIPDCTEVAGLRARYGNPMVLAVGRLVYYKGFEFLVRAMRDVPGTLVIVGDGPLRPQLEQLGRELGLADRMHLVSGCSDEQLHAHHHASDVFVLPAVARSEAFGIVQTEAMAAGRPVINTQLDSGVPFVSLHGVTGLTVPPSDPTALAAALRQLLNNPSLRAMYGSAAQERVRTEFQTDIMVKRTLHLYERATIRTAVPSIKPQAAAGIV